MVLELHYICHVPDEKKSFNPCEGFGGFGTSFSGESRSSKFVSIPVRDLVVLEPVHIQLGRTTLIVSIPVRDLVVLERNQESKPGRENNVSIPVRDLVVLEHNSKKQLYRATYVSIPVRDLVVLELRLPLPWLSPIQFQSL